MSNNNEFKFDFSDCSNNEEKKYVKFVGEKVNNMRRWLNDKRKIQAMIETYSLIEVLASYLKIKILENDKAIVDLQKVGAKTWAKVIDESMVFADGKITETLVNRSWKVLVADGFLLPLGQGKRNEQKGFTPVISEWLEKEQKALNLKFAKLLDKPHVPQASPGKKTDFTSDAGVNLAKKVFCVDEKNSEEFDDKIVSMYHKIYHHSFIRSYFHRVYCLYDDFKHIEEKFENNRHGFKLIPSLLEFNKDKGNHKYEIIYMKNHMFSKSTLGEWNSLALGRNADDPCLLHLQITYRTLMKKESRDDSCFKFKLPKYKTGDEEKVKTRDIWVKPVELLITVHPEMRIFVSGFLMDQNPKEGASYSMLGEDIFPDYVQDPLKVMNSNYCNFFKNVNSELEIIEGSKNYS